MAPSCVAVPCQAGMKQPDMRDYFGKITKAAAWPVSKAALESTGATIQAKDKVQLCPTTTSKRKRRNVDEEQDENGRERIPTSVRVKKPKLQQSKTRISASASNRSENYVSSAPLEQPAIVSNPRKAPNASPAATKPITLQDLPPTLQDILDLHQCFLKALSIHNAHNGIAVPAELTKLMKTMTRLYKKHAIVQADVQRMLALYELSGNTATASPGKNRVAHHLGPFKLTSSGLANAHTCVEYTGVQYDETTSTKNSQNDCPVRIPFSEKNLQSLYKAEILILFLALRNDSKSHLAFLNGPLSCFPLLSCAIGTQTTLQQQKVTTLRNEIVNISAAAQKRQTNRSALIHDTGCVDDEKPSGKILIKSRAQSLFDRVAAKKAQNASSSKPTPADIVRRHAIGRIEELVEILRMKQQQKATIRPNSAGHYEDVLAAAVKRCKTSFSTRQLESDIRDSASVPISGEEVRACLTMLAEELPGGWIKLLESGDGERRNQFVVIEGEGMRGQLVRKFLEEKESKRTKEWEI